MLEILKFIFSDFWIFCGIFAMLTITLHYLVAGFAVMSKIIKDMN